MTELSFSTRNKGANGGGDFTHNDACAGCYWSQSRLQSIRFNQDKMCIERHTTDTAGNYEGTKDCLQSNCPLSRRFDPFRHRQASPTSSASTGSSAYTVFIEGSMAPTKASRNEEDKQTRPPARRKQKTTHHKGKQEKKANPKAPQDPSRRKPATDSSKPTASERSK